MKTIIIGKQSNLSQKLKDTLDNVILVSSRDILDSTEILSVYKNQKINIIFNNFQPAIGLNKLENPVDYINNAILVTSGVLEYFKSSKINKIIYTSSSSVYGNNILCTETDELKPISLHASLKLSNEKLIEKYCLEKGVDYTIARVFNMYGANDVFSIISKIISAARSKEELSIINNGKAIRDFIHINDVAVIYSKLLSMKNTNIINIGTGDGNSVSNILRFLLNHAINVNTKNIFRDELKTSTANNQLLKNIIGKYDFIKIEDYLLGKFKL